MAYERTGARILVDDASNIRALPEVLERGKETTAVFGFEARYLGPVYDDVYSDFTITQSFDAGASGYLIDFTDREYVLLDDYDEIVATYDQKVLFQESIAQIYYRKIMLTRSCDVASGMYFLAYLDKKQAKGGKK